MVGPADAGSPDSPIGPPPDAGSDGGGMPPPDGGPVGCVVAAGTDGLISDFTNQAITYALDGRTSEPWQVYNLTPGMDMMSVATDGVNYFLHCVLADLDATCGVRMTKTCYDARAYTGLELTFKEGQPFDGKALLALRTLATVPRSEGGNCDLGINCNDSFHVNLNVPGTGWSGAMRIPFSQFAQAGFGLAPPGYVAQAEIFSIAIAPQPGVGVDIDIDDVQFY
jgi:hypothetical protein